ncbi:MAG: DUF58 domain-containing protein [Gammaproteobacteria bacterium]
MWTSRNRPEAALAAAGTRDAAHAAAGTRDAAHAEGVLRRLEWTVIRRLDGQLQGDFRTLFRGAGMDLADLREYQHHDDVRHIDWNVTARLDTPHVRQFTESREIDAWFLLDLSASVDFGSGPSSKLDMARDFTAVLARLLARHGNRVGATLYGAGVEATLPARGGRAQVLGLLHRIATRPPPTRPPPARPHPTDLAELFRRADDAIRRRSLVFVVSDFQSLPGWHDALGRLAVRHEVVAVRVVDPLERELPDLGVVTIQDAETGEQLQVDTHDRGFRRRFAEAAARRETALQEAFARAGVDVLELATDDDLADAVLRFARLRRLRNRLGAGGAR